MEIRHQRLTNSVIIEVTSEELYDLVKCVELTTNRYSDYYRNFYNIKLLNEFEEFYKQREEKWKADNEHLD